MSINNAMQAAISGLRANSSAVGRISENIANVGTDGYRRSFEQMITRATGTAGSTPTLGVRTETASDITLSGSIRSTGNTTDLAISGAGFLAVTREPAVPGAEGAMLTRAGSFRVDEAGFMRNAAGFYLQGFAYDANGALPPVDRTRFGDLVPVNIGGLTMPGEATSTITLRGNLPAQLSGQADPGDPFISSSVYYTPLGEAGQLRFAWQPTATPNTWTLTVANGDGTTYGSVDIDFSPSGPGVGAPAGFANIVDASGTGVFSIDPATGTIRLDLPAGATTQPIDIALGAPGSLGGMTQFAGGYQPVSARADGAAFGVLSRTEIDAKGDMYGIFDNGVRKVLFNIPLVMVASPNNLQPLDGNAYRAGWEAGAIMVVTPGEAASGTMISGALEGSNVEMSEELTGLIQAQRAFSSNAKVVTTADEMLEEALRLKR
jgi:flagellar hook protein FlgE